MGKDTSTNKQEKITITNDKGRLSKEEIEKMVNEAEKYKEEDDKLRQKVESKNKLESYCYQMKNTVEDEKMKDKISEEDKKKIIDKCEEGTKWMDDNSDATKEEYDDKQKEVESVCAPIITELYKAAGGAPGGMPDMSGMGGMGGDAGAPPPSSGGAGPTIE